MSAVVAEVKPRKKRGPRFPVRGQKLPQSKLTNQDIRDIKSARLQREKLLAYIRENLSNEAIAARFGVHHRTVEKVLQGQTWRHVN